MKTTLFSPANIIPAWMAPRPASAEGNEFMHYVRLGESNGGLGAMMENPNKNDPNWWQRAPFSDKWQK
jgi:hypothetical protein